MARSGLQKVATLQTSVLDPFLRGREVLPQKRILQRAFLSTQHCARLLPQLRMYLKVVAVHLSQGCKEACMLLAHTLHRVYSAVQHKCLFLTLASCYLFYSPGSCWCPTHQEINTHKCYTFRLSCKTIAHQFVFPRYSFLIIFKEIED